MVSALDSGSSGSSLGIGEFNAGGVGNLAMDLHPTGSRNAPSRFMLLKPKLRAGLMGHLAHKQT